MRIVPWNMCTTFENVDHFDSNGFIKTHILGFRVCIVRRVGGVQNLRSFRYVERNFKHLHVKGQPYIESTVSMKIFGTYAVKK